MATDLGGPLEAPGGQDRKQSRGTPFLEPSWARLGGLLGPSWRLDRRLGPSWGRLGAVLGRLDGQNRAQSRSKLDAKIDNFLMLFEIGFLMDFGRFGEPKRSQVGTKMGSKIHLILKTPESYKAL